MKDALKIINSNKIYIKIFREISNKYKTYERFTGSFTLKPMNEEEMYVLYNFDNQVFLNNKAKINVSKVVNLFESKLHNNSFKELVEYVLKDELISNRQSKRIKITQEENFYKNIFIECKAMMGVEWIKKCISEKQYGYNLLSKYYNLYLENGDLDSFKNIITSILKAIEILPYKENNYENISIFAAKVTKNPHFFDKNKFTGSLLIHAISYILKLDYPKTIDELNELYYKVGLLKDELSNHTTIYGFDGYKNNKEVKVLNEYKKWKEPLQISISNLLKIDVLKCQNNKVFIFENPSVFNQIRLRIDNVSLICTSGQLNLSSYMILDKIRDIDTIYYAGDFDPEGIHIAYRLKKRYGKHIKFILYKKDIYNSIKSDEDITDKRLSIIKNIKCDELTEIIEAILINKKPAYQELLVDEYLNFIVNNI